MKFYIQIILLILGIASAATSLAQDCKDMKTETDAFTKLQTKTIKGGFDLEFNADLVKTGEKTII